jgi:tetratricopeptide (TPR) repeat protein
VHRLAQLFGFLFFATSSLCAPIPAGACELADDAIRELARQGQFEAAESAAKKRVLESPDSVEAHITLGSVYVEWARSEGVAVDTQALGFASGETGTRVVTPELAQRAIRSEVRLDPAMAKAATEVFERVARRWPDRWESHLCVLELHQVGGHHKALLAALARTARQFAAGGPDTVDRLLPFGNYYYKRRQFPDALEVMETLRAVFPNSAPVLSSLGVVRIESEQLEEAMALFRRAHELAPKDMLVVRNLATDAMYLGRLEDAAAALEILREAQPDQTNILFQLAVVATARAPAEARAAWTQYLGRHAVRPDGDDWASFARSTSEAFEKGIDDGSVIAMARALGSGGSGLALALWHGLIRRHPNDASLRFLMAQAYENEKLPKHAYASLQRAQKLLGHPDPLVQVEARSVRYEAGRLALGLDRFAESIQYLRAVEKEAPDTQHLQYMLGLAHGRAGHRDEAIRYYRRCLELPNNAEYAHYCRQNLESSNAPASTPESASNP